MTSGPNVTLPTVLFVTCPKYKLAELLRLSRMNWVVTFEVEFTRTLEKATPTGKTGVPAIFNVACCVHVGTA